MKLDPRDYVDDPILPPTGAAGYLGISTRTLRKLAWIDRDPMPGTGNTWGYRRSTLNRALRQLAEERKRAHLSGAEGTNGALAGAA